MRSLEKTLVKYGTQNIKEWQEVTLKIRQFGTLVYNKQLLAINNLVSNYTFISIFTQNTGKDINLSISSLLMEDKTAFV